jgi:hypothetical protein
MNRIITNNECERSSIAKIFQEAIRIELSIDMSDGNTYEFRKFPTEPNPLFIDTIGDFEVRNAVEVFNPVTQRKKRRDAIVK